MKRDTHFTGQHALWMKKDTSGVGFAVEKRLIENIIETPKTILDCLMKMRIFAFATVFSVYVPTLPCSDTAKERFYEELCRALRAVSTTDKLIVLGDFNARVGSDHETWEGLDEATANGELLLSLCVDFDIASTNSYFSVPDTWF